MNIPTVHLLLRLVLCVIEKSFFRLKKWNVIMCLVTILGVIIIF